MNRDQLIKAAEEAIAEDVELSIAEDIRTVIDAIEPLIRADERRIERAAVTNWLVGEMNIAMARHSFTVAATLRRASLRLSIGTHRTRKAAS